jgi:hypothetical protein
MKVNIHNQCVDFKLTSQSWFKRSIDWYKEFDMEIDAGSMTSADLTSYWTVFESSLTYHLQRKRAESDNQLESTYTLLLITWKYEGYKELCACVHLLEYDKQIKWNLYKLGEYHQRYASQLSTYAGPIKDTWLMHDGTVLMTRLKLDFTQRVGVLNIVISEGVMDEPTKIPSWISPKM